MKKIFLPLSIYLSFSALVFAQTDFRVYRHYLKTENENSKAVVSCTNEETIKLIQSQTDNLPFGSVLVNMETKEGTLQLFYVQNKDKKRRHWLHIPNIHNCVIHFSNIREY
tara:strand:- start:280 stop:612 length:333 start_codon:yes stop_codon:yes gene_type:complete